MAAVAEKQEHNLVTLASEEGNTTIQPHVVAKIAGLAVREVDGVARLAPFGASQTLTSFANNIRGAEMRDLGVNVEVGKVEAAVDVRVVAEYGESIPRIAHEIRTNVARWIGDMTGLRVAEVNIEVTDLAFEDEAPPPADLPRVE